jgi:hypothetical protein
MEEALRMDVIDSGDGLIGDKEEWSSEHLGSQ